MAATSQNLKDFFALSGNNPAVTDGQLQSVSDWLTDNLGLNNVVDVLGVPTLPPPADADDLVDYFYRHVREQVLNYKRRTTTVTF